jgi:hypothetical protein
MSFRIRDVYNDTVTYQRRVTWIMRRGFGLILDLFSQDYKQQIGNTLAPVAPWILFVKLFFVLCLLRRSFVYVLILTDSLRELTGYCQLTTGTHGVLSTHRGNSWGLTGDFQMTAGTEHSVRRILIIELLAGPVESTALPIVEVFQSWLPCDHLVVL